MAINEAGKDSIQYELRVMSEYHKQTKVMAHYAELASLQCTGHKVP